MKRLWFAIIFLVVIAALCSAEQLYIEHFYREMSASISAAEDALTGGDEQY